MVEESHFNSGEEITPLSLKQSYQALWNVPVGISKFTPEGRLFFVNPFLARLLGYSSPEELYSYVHGLSEQLYADLEDKVRLKRLLETRGEAQNYECRLVCRGGSTVWVSINSQVVFKDDGQLNYIQCFVRDISARKETEEALEAEQEFFSTLFDNLQEAVVVCNEMGRIVRFNEAARLLHGVPEQPITPDRWAEFYDLYRPDGVTLLPVEEIPLYRALQGERVHDEEIMVAPKNSSPKIMMCTGQPLMDAKGSRLGALVAMFDVTRRKQAEEKVQEQKQLLESIINGTSDILASQDLDRNIEFMNQKGYERLSLSPEEAKGKKCFELLGRDKECSSCILEQVMQGKKLARAETLVPELGGYFDYRAVPVLDEEGNVIKVVKHLRDITARKELEQLKEDVERITRHDLKTPLNGILGIPQLLLEDDNLRQDQRELLEHIQMSGHRMLDMINMSLSLYQIERGEYQVQPQPIDLLAVLQGLQKDLEPLLRTHKISLSWSLPGRAEEENFLVYAEKLLCYTMLSNLIKNAVEATPPGEKVLICLEEADKDLARISIHNPMVIPEEVQNRFGQKYVTTGKRQGTGLGVYSAHLIAQTMQGSLSWQSTEQEGTWVKVTLPRPPDWMSRWAG